MYSHIGVLSRHTSQCMRNQTGSSVSRGRQQKVKNQNIRRMVNGIARTMNNEGTSTQKENEKWIPNEKFKKHVFRIEKKSGKKVGASKIKGIVNFASSNGRVFMKVELTFL